jgi:HK97 family phage portal protein
MSWYSPLTEPVKSLFGRSVQTKSDPSYQITAQFYSPGQPIWSDRNYASFVKEAYKKCGPVYACINKIAGAAASIKWKLYTDRTMSREIESHPLLDLWRHPNPGMGTAELIEQMFGFLHLDGNSYLWANRPNPNEPPTELWPLRPDLIKIVAGQYDIGGYVYGWGTGNARDFDVDQIMHLLFPSYSDSYYGLSPIEVAMRTVDQMNAGNDWNTALMQNDGKPSALFTSKGYLTTEQRTQVKKELKTKYSGKGNAGKPLVLEADMGYQNMAIPPKELDWLQSRGFNRNEIASILDVPPILVGDQTGQTYANLKEAKQSLFTENVLPKMYRLVDHTNIWLVPMYDDLAKSGAYFSYDKKDIEVLAELYTSIEQAFAERALNLWNDGGCTLRYLQEVQGMEPQKKTYLDVYKIGAVLVREEDIEEYAMQSLQKPAAPPAPVPEPLLNPVPGQPALPAPKPATTVTEVPPDDTPVPGKGKTLQGVSPLAAPASRYRSGRERKVIDLATKEDKTAYAAKMEADRVRWEAVIAARLQDYFKGEQKVVVKAIEGCSTEQEADEMVVTALSGQQDALMQVIYDAWLDVSVDIGGQVDSALSGKKGIIADFIKLFGNSQLKYLLTLCGNKIKQITATTQAAIRLELTDGVAKGESIIQMAKRIDTLYLDQIIPNRSMTIAATEVVGSSSYASNEAAAQSGLTLLKVWLATEDNHTRPAHADANGQKVAMDQPFIVGGEELKYPGDPDGSAANIISCRCCPYYERVVGPDDSDDEDDSDEEKRLVASLADRNTPATREVADAYGRLIAKRRDFSSVREFMKVTV